MPSRDDIDVDYCFFDDTPDGKDPDSHSPTLRTYHRLLWSKDLPDGRPFSLHQPRALSPYLVYEADGLRLVFGSDTIATRHARRLSGLFSQVSEAENNAFLRRAYTICGFAIFPVRRNSINQRRGTHRRIEDRWDLTLEAIKRHYEGGTSPLTDVLAQDAAFFALFGSFRGYVEHFMFEDFLDSSDRVRMLLPFDDFKTPALPADLEAYRAYRAASLELFRARRDRIYASLT